MLYMTGRPQRQASNTSNPPPVLHAHAHSHQHFIVSGWISNQRKHLTGTALIYTQTHNPYTKNNIKIKERDWHHFDSDRQDTDGVCVCLARHCIRYLFNYCILGPEEISHPWVDFSLDGVSLFMACFSDMIISPCERRYTSTKRGKFERAAVFKRVIKSLCCFQSPIKAVMQVKFKSLLLGEFL